MTTPSAHDPELSQAMRFYDQVINDTERREVFRTVYQAALAAHRTGSTAPLRDLAASLVGMVAQGTNQPGLRDRMRNAPRTARQAGGTVDYEEAHSLLKLGQQGGLNTWDF